MDTAASEIEVAVESDEPKTTIDAFFNAGQLFPINNTESLESGTGFGFSVKLTKNNFFIWKRIFSISRN